MLVFFRNDRGYWACSRLTFMGLVRGVLADLLL